MMDESESTGCCSCNRFLCGVLLSVGLLVFVLILLRPKESCKETYEFNHTLVVQTQVGVSATHPKTKVVPVCKTAKNMKFKLKIPENEVFAFKSVTVSGAGCNITWLSRESSYTGHCQQLKDATRTKEGNTYIHVINSAIKLDTYTYTIEYAPLGSFNRGYKSYGQICLIDRDNYTPYKYILEGKETCP